MIGEIDVFVSGGVEVVFADIHPAIGDIVKIREDRLIDDHLIGLACVTDRINSAFRGGFDRRDADINRIKSVVCAGG